MEELKSQNVQAKPLTSMQKYYQKHKEYFIEKAKKYYREHREDILARQHSEEGRAKQRTYKYKNRLHISEQRREHYHLKKKITMDKCKNSDKCSDSCWKTNNPSPMDIVNCLCCDKYEP